MLVCCPLGRDCVSLKGSEARYSKANGPLLIPIKAIGVSWQYKQKSRSCHSCKNITTPSVPLGCAVWAHLAPLSASNKGVRVMSICWWSSSPGPRRLTRSCNWLFFLEALFGRRVELVTPESLSPHIGPHILRELTSVNFDETLSPAHTHRDPVSPRPGAGAGERDLSAR